MFRFHYVSIMFIEYATFPLSFLRSMMSQSQRKSQKIPPPQSVYILYIFFVFNVKHYHIFIS